MRIESDKLDKLFVNVGNLCNIANKSHKNFQNLSDIATKFSSKMFELEKSLNELKTLVNDKNNSGNLVTKLSDEIQKKSIKKLENSF